MPNSRSERIGAVAIVAVVLGWGALLLVQGGRLCNSDCVVEMLPRLIAVARAFQGGFFALWDSHTFSGARPFWETIGGNFYPILYPFYWFADLASPLQAALLLQVIPYLLHIAWAGLGGYFFGRRILLLDTPGALIVGFGFSFSPMMLDIALVTQAYGYSYLPWILLAATQFLDDGSARTWAFGAALVGALSYAANPDTVNRTLVLVGFQVGCYALASWRDQRSLRSLLGRLAWLVVMVLVGLATYSFGWIGEFRGIQMGLGRKSLTCAQVATYAEYSSTSPTALLSLFFPGMFFRLETLASGGGALLLSFVAYAIAHLRRLSREGRRWLGIAVALLAFSTLVSVGDHTPVFGWLCSGVPAFFGFPHPARYQLGMCWSLVLLAGIGTSALRRNTSLGFGTILFFWPLVLAALIAWRAPQLPSFDWQLGSISALQYVAMAALAVVVALILPQRRRARALGLLVLVEVLLTPLAFPSKLPPESQTPIDWAEFPSWTVTHNPMLELRESLDQIARAGEYRFVGTRAVVDNQAWIVNGRALLGMMAKPVAASFEHAFSSFTFGSPNLLWLTGLPWLLPNMNVGYIVADREADYFRFLGEEIPTCSNFADTLATLPLINQTEHFSILKISEALPYAYTQDRVFVAAPELQLERLVSSDLREGIYLSPEAPGNDRRTWPAAPARIERPLGACEIDDRSFLAPSSVDPAVLTHFAELQNENLIAEIDHATPNALTLEAEIRRPAFLVIAETWHPDWEARVDGKAVPLLQVNYLQQALWLEPGRHTVSLRFMPRAFQYGLAASALALTMIAAAWWSGGSNGRRKLSDS